MKNLWLTLTTLLASVLITSCATQPQPPLTHPQQCQQLGRQIAAYRQPNSGYAWNVAELKIQQLQDKAHELGC